VSGKEIYRGENCGKCREAGKRKKQTNTDQGNQEKETRNLHKRVIWKKLERTNQRINQRKPVRNSLVGQPRNKNQKTESEEKKGKKQGEEGQIRISRPSIRVMKARVNLFQCAYKAKRKEGGGVWW